MREQVFLAGLNDGHTVLLLALPAAAEPSRSCVEEAFVCYEQTSKIFFICTDSIRSAYVHGHDWAGRMTEIEELLVIMHRASTSHQCWLLTVSGFRKKSSLVKGDRYCFLRLSISFIFAPFFLPACLSFFSQRKKCEVLTTRVFSSRSTLLGKCCGRRKRLYNVINRLKKRSRPFQFS